MRHLSSPDPKPQEAAGALLLFLAGMLCAARPAWAYIDPGTGSYVLQMALALIVSSLFILKSFLKKMVRKTARLLRKDLRHDGSQANP
jgi:hypothetical protein